MRPRYETDWDSQKSDGSLRDDRARLRYRTRLGLKIHPADGWVIGVRSHTGAEESPQSPHLTFDDFSNGPEDDFSGVIDQYYLKGSFGDLNGWIGRNEFPFFSANESELFWDKDATLLGGYLEYKIPCSSMNAHIRGGYFALPDGGTAFGGAMAALQIYLNQELSKGWDIGGSLGYFDLRGDSASRHLQDGASFGRKTIARIHVLFYLGHL